VGRPPAGPLTQVDDGLTVRPIRTIGDPVLATAGRDVTSFDEHLAGLIQDLLDTVRLPGRAGLAAPQIGVGLRVFSYRIQGEEGYVVNPTVTLTEGDQSGPEGCLSIPDVWVECPRAMHVVVAGFDADGNALEVEGTGALARCLQHETDHLAGVLFIDRLDRPARKEAMRAIRERALFESVQLPDRSGPSWLSHY
jgi:peptide deformylase